MTQPYKYRIKKDELAKVLDKYFSSKEFGNLETTCYRLSKTPLIGPVGTGSVEEGYQKMHRINR